MLQTAATASMLTFAAIFMEVKNALLHGQGAGATHTHGQGRRDCRVHGGPDQGPGDPEEEARGGDAAATPFGGQ
eukprot:2367674-Pyramimonas_sp.AAC.1